MLVVLLICISAVSAIGQASWQDLSRLARQRQAADDFRPAESLWREALRLAEKQPGLAEKQLAPLLSDLALCLHFEARDAEAEPLAQRALSIAKESNDQRLTGLMLNILGIVLSGEGQKARAEPVLRRSAALLEEDSLDFARAANNLAMLYQDTHQYARAEAEMTRVLPIYERRLGENDPESAQVLGNMFSILAVQHRGDEGEPYLRRALAAGEKVFPGSLKMANLQVCLAALEASREHLRDAARLLETAIATEERILGPEHPELAHTLACYARVLGRMHQKTEAKNALHRANMILKTSLSDVK